MKNPYVLAFKKFKWTLLASDILKLIPMGLSPMPNKNLFGTRVTPKLLKVLLPPKYPYSSAVLYVGIDPPSDN